MSFHEIQFPPQISYGATGGPSWHTTVITLASGAEKRNVDWSRHRLVYDVAQGLKTQAELNTLLKFFYARQGKAYGFRFKDWADYQVPFPQDTLPLLFITNGSTQSFQLFKVYQDSAAAYVRVINKPVPGSLQLYDNGGPSANFELDPTTGIVTLINGLQSTSGHVISGSFQFDVPVRFDTDEMKVALENYNNYSWNQIPVIELRLP